MPNEMNHADLADRLEFIREDGALGNAITLTPLGENTLADAAADERRIANGKLVEVIRCCECIYHVEPPIDNEGGIEFLYCNRPYQMKEFPSIIVDFTDFCSCGKRKEENHEQHNQQAP